jgi:signal transduction histidine kinase
MPNGGRLRIAAQRETGATGLASLEDGDYVRMTVIDTGTGMDKRR